MNLNVKALHLITATFIVTLALLIGGLYYYQTRQTADLPKVHEHAPSISPDRQLEFESGQLSREQKERSPNK